ncbi:MAG: DUF4150 domain-containing protein, partial [Betaproteobacteria bacterium]|nr:DUF4150 domain-containing protein [Betaproteobacteria bacterium]
DGSSSVQISGQEVMLKDKSCFKKSMGDEAGCAPKKGVVTSKNMGKVYFTAWSMNVKVEGENVVRMGDLTTHNHGSVPGNTGPWPYLDEVAVAPGGACHDGKGPMVHLKLVPKKPGCDKAADGSHRTPHHLIPGRCTKGMSGFNYDKAPCICVQGKNQHTGSHKACHRRFDKVERYHFEEKGGQFSYGEAKSAASDSAGGAMDPPRDLSPKEKACIAAQLEAYYTQKPPDGPGLNDNSPVKASGAAGKVNEDYEDYANFMKSAQTSAFG